MEIVSLDSSYRIPSYNVDAFLERVAKFTKRAAKSGAFFSVRRLYNLELNKVENMLSGLKRNVCHRYTVFQVASDEAINIPGWTLLGVVDRKHSEPVFYCAPDQTIPDSFRDSEGFCDHCGTRRRRNETFVLQHAEKGVMQVGRNCLADFIADANPHQILFWMQTQIAACGFDEFATERDYGWHSDRDHNVLMEFLPMVARVIREHGWLSSSAARQMEEGPSPTFAVALHELMPLSSYEKAQGVVRLVVEEQDIQTALAACDWPSQLPRDSDYVRNMQVLLKDEWFRNRECGLVASIVGSYTRHLAKEAVAKQAERVKAEAQPVPEGRIDIRGVVVSVKAHYNDFGTRYVMTVQDERGFKVWGTVPSNISAEAGMTVSFKATVSRSDKDETFGFFKRPTNAEVVS